MQAKTTDWKELCDDPKFNDLPYRIETDERGRILMSPMYAYHGNYQFIIGKNLDELLKNGKVTVECAVKTSKGTKVVDVAWFSLERWEKVKDEYDVSIAPEICIEVLSPSNTKEEMEEKRELYFESGAKEFWICDKEGNMSFFNSERKLEHSELVNSFPGKIQ